MAKLGAGSLAKLGECHPDLQRVVRRAVELMPASLDLTVLCGWRGKVDQDLAYKQGKSKLRYPESRHNRVPAEAVDLAPFPIDWNDHAAFTRLATYVLAAAADLGVRITWGGHWRGFPDLPHFELS